MKKVAVFSTLLIVGIVGSQLLPLLLGPTYDQIEPILLVLTMTGLAFIMIHVGYEFEIDKSNLGQYGWDYVVAMTAAAFPWIFASLYFVFIMLPSDMWGSVDAWKESIVLDHFRGGERVCLRGAPAGRYELRVSAHGYNDCFTPPFLLSEGGEKDLGEIALDPCGNLVLKVINRKGQLLDDYTCFCNEVKLPKRGRLALSGGRFSYNNLPLGGVTVRIHADGYRDKEIGLDLLPGLPAEATAVLDRN